MCLLTEAIYDAEYAPAMSVLTVAVYDTAVCFFFNGPEKYNFDLYKGFFMEKKRPKFARFLKGINYKSPDFYNTLPRIIKGLWFFLLLYLVCSQIWLNHLMDDRHFSYITIFL
jgi:hypothetical protein